MAIKGATFDLQTVLAKYDGAMYNALSNNHDGYVSWTGSGNPITFTDTNVLTLKNGYILVHGRLIVVDGATGITLNPGSSISSGDGRLVLQIDTSKTNTQTVLNQVEILQEYKATSASWRALSTDDINALSTGVYEVQLCHFTVANGTSSGVQIDISTDTIIGNLQDDIETLADNLEQTASDVGDLQALGLSVPIPVNKGGSGLTSNPSMLTNLASTAAAGIFQASPRPGVTGTLPIGNGGTGASTQAGAQSNLGILPHVYYRSQYNFYPLTQELIDDLYLAIGKNAIVSLTAADGTRPICLINWGNANYGCVSVFSQRPTLSFDQWQKNGGVWTNVTASQRAQKVTFKSEALTGLSAKQLKAATSTNLIGTDVADVVEGRNYITLGKGVFRIHTHFATTCAANGYIKSCLKIGSTSTSFIMTDQFYAGAGAGSSSTILGVNASDVISVTSDSGANIYFLVMSSGNADGFNASMTIEQIHP